jgi:hypothetical protein
MAFTFSWCLLAQFMLYISKCQTIDLAISSVSIDLADIKTANFVVTKLPLLVDKLTVFKQFGNKA